MYQNHTVVFSYKRSKGRATESTQARQAKPGARNATVMVRLGTSDLGSAVTEVMTTMAGTTTIAEAKHVDRIVLTRGNTNRRAHEW